MDTAQSSFNQAKLALWYLEHAGTERRFYLLLGLPGRAPSLGLSGVVSPTGNHQGGRVWVRDELVASGKTWAEALRADETLRRYRPVGGRMVSPKSGAVAASGTLPGDFDPANRYGRANLELIWQLGAKLAKLQPEARMAGNGIPDFIARPIADYEPDAPSDTSVKEPSAGGIRRPPIVVIGDSKPTVGEPALGPRATSKAIHESIATRVVALLEQGVVPWRAGWLKAGPPRNITGRPYRGINHLMLSVAGHKIDGEFTHFSSPIWLAAKQVQKRGGTIRSGERPMPVVWYGKYTIRETDPDTGEEKEKRIPLMREYDVWNVEQVEGIEIPDPIANEAAKTPIEAAEAIIAGMPNPPKVSSDGGDRAYYRPSTDSVHLPKPAHFESAELRYSTTFHELAHSTAHETRCGRDIHHNFGSEQYGYEELVAEVSASMLCAEAGIETLDPQAGSPEATATSSANYIANWIQKIKADPRCLVMASSQAQAAVDHILDRARIESASATNK